MRKLKEYVELREGDRAHDQWRSDRGALHDYTLKHRAWFEWNLNDQAKVDMMFRFNITCEHCGGINSAVFDWEEMLRIGRWI